MKAASWRRACAGKVDRISTTWALFVDLIVRHDPTLGLVGLAAAWGRAAGVPHGADAIGSILRRARCLSMKASTS